MTSDGTIHGPLSRDQLQQWFDDGRIKGDCLVMESGRNQWRKATEFFAELSASSRAGYAADEGYELKPLASTASNSCVPVAVAGSSASITEAKLELDADGYPRTLHGWRFWVVEATSLADEDAPPAPDPAVRRKVAIPAVGLMVAAVLSVVGQWISLLGMQIEPDRYESTYDVVRTALAWIIPQGQSCFANIYYMIMSAFVFISALSMRHMKNFRYALLATSIMLVPGVSPNWWVGLPVGLWSLAALARRDVRQAFIE